MQQRGLTKPVVPNLFRLALQREIYSTRHLVAHLFALGFDDSLKMYFFNDILKNVLSRGTPGYCNWHPRVPRHPVGNHWGRQSQPSRRGRITVGSCRINPLVFADDLVLLVSFEQGLQHALDRFAAAVCCQAGMKMSCKRPQYCFSLENQASVL